MIPSLDCMLQAALAPSKVCRTCNSQFGSGEIFCPVDGTRLINRSQIDGGRPTDPNDALVGVTLAGRYRITRRIGEGGMGIVYEARHVIIEKRVAVKVLRDDCSNRPDVVERFRQEARSASLIGHEHIVDISDFGETPTGQSYFVMEMLEGEDLANLLGRLGTIEIGRALNIVQQCAKALGAAHAKGIVHRDMKPENIFLTHREGNPDFVKIVDFGIAKMSDIETAGDPSRKLTKTGMIFGTPEYMSPEQSAGKPLDHRVDIYAMGVILYEMLTGRVPFVGDTFMGILTQHLFEPPPPMLQVNANCEVTRGVESLIKKALQKDAKARFQTMEELADELGRERESLEEVTAVGLRGPVRTFAKRLTGSDMRRATVATADRPAWLSPKPRLRPWMMVTGIAAIAALAVGLWRVQAVRKTAVKRVRMVEKAPQKPEKPEPVPKVVLVPAINPVPSAPAPPADQPLLAQVRVTTRPLGGSVSIEGRGQVCTGDPCSFSTPLGKSIRVQAVQGRAVASRTFSPTSAEEELTLALHEPKTNKKPRRALPGEASEPPPLATRPAPAPAEPPTRSKRQMGDLKVPDIFR